MVRLLVALISLFMAVACSPAAREAQQYELRGQILAIKPEDGEVLIKHEDIKNFMPAMTMPYKVRDKAILQGKVRGDLVTATLNVASTEAWLSTLEKTGSAPLDQDAAIPAAAFVTPLAPGSLVPDTELIDQQGKRFSLREWRGQAFAITFMYVRCPLPQFCPLLDRRFAEVQKAIVSTPALNGHARLLSVSFDPDADTPAQLAAHAARLRADTRIWQFATAPREVVDRFAAQFGVNVVREKDQTITHNMRTLVIDREGRVVSVHEGSDWTAAQVADDLQRALAR
jgi:protein SCO1/2